jgi:hypothetical protein
MLRSRRLVRIYAWLVAVCLLFAQSAAIAYACPRGEAMLDATAVEATPCAQHVATADDAAPPASGVFAPGNVCEVHCQTPSLPDGGAMDLPSIVVATAWLVPARPVASGSASPASDIEARSAAPPFLALFARLLI